MTRLLPILLAVLGVFLAVYVVATAQEKLPTPPPAQPPSVNPFAAGISSLGLIEPALRAVEVAAPEAARVEAVHVEVGQQVTQGQPLFELDAVLLRAELLRARAGKLAADAEVERLRRWPRAEDFPPAEAEVAEATARLHDAEDRLRSLEAARAGQAASDDEVSRQRFTVQAHVAVLANAQARLARMRAGSWAQDVAVAQATTDARQAEVDALELRLARMTVRAPKDGTVLKRNIEPGEFASSGAGQASGGSSRGASAPIVIGDLREMHIRAQVDEEDAPLLSDKARAVARVRGPLNAQIPLTLLRIEPFAAPKTQISGAATELIDTRVIEVVFRADLSDPSLPPIYSGQVVDVFIEVQPAGEAPPRQAGTAGAPARAGATGG